MTMSKVQETGPDSYGPSKRLHHSAHGQAQPASRNSTKTFTSFSIDSILGSSPHREHISDTTNNEEGLYADQNSHKFENAKFIKLDHKIDHKSDRGDENIVEKHSNNVRKNRNNEDNSHNHSHYHSHSKQYNHTASHQANNNHPSPKLTINKYNSNRSHTFTPESKTRNDDNRVRIESVDSPIPKHPSPGFMNGKQIKDFGGLLNLTQAHQINGFRAALALSPPLISPLAGFPKMLLPGLSSPFHFDPRTIIPHQHISPTVRPNSTNNISATAPNRLRAGTGSPNTTNNAKIIRPWDNLNHRHDLSRSPLSRTPPSQTNMAAPSASEASSDEEEEISVDDDEPMVTTTTLSATSNKNNKNKSSVSPLDALMAMTSKTFAGLDKSGGSGKHLFTYK